MVESTSGRKNIVSWADIRLDEKIGPRGGTTAILRKESEAQEQKGSREGIKSLGAKSILRREVGPPDASLEWNQNLETQDISKEGDRHLLDEGDFEAIGILEEGISSLKVWVPRAWIQDLEEQ